MFRIESHGNSTPHCLPESLRAVNGPVLPPLPPTTAEETTQGKNQVIVLSHAFWQKRFGGSREVIGRTLRGDSESVTVIVA